MQATLSVRQVTKSFGEVPAVAGVSFEVRPGEIFGFLGPNGAGKTTTLRMIMDITRPDSGSIEFEDGGRLDRRRVGYLPEERGLFDDAPVLDTLVYLAALRGVPRSESAPAARQWMERLELGDRIASKVGQLSKGNQQKVQFAAAVLHRPALAVLDEPFSGLDPLNQDLFVKWIADLRAQGTAVLLSAHQLALVERMCDRVQLIARGRELFSGTLPEIRREAARGAEEVLSVILGPARPGSSSDPLAALGALSPGMTAESRPLPEGRQIIDLSLPHGTDLAPLIQRLGEGFAVERVAMRELSLHEIYVRAVRGTAAAADIVEDPMEATHA